MPLSPTPHPAPEPFVGQIQEALRDWHKPSADESPLRTLVLVRQQLRQTDGHLRRAINQVLRCGIQAVAEGNSDGAAILTQHYVEEKKISQIAAQMNLAEAAIYKRQQQATQQLAQWVWSQEEEARHEAVTLLSDRLESPTYSQLFGVDEHLTHLTEIINTPASPWLIAIEGLGGLGKTALTDRLLRHLIASPVAATQWGNIAWITARQHICNLGGGLPPIAKPALSAEGLIEALYAQLQGVSGGPARSLTEQRRWLQTRLTREPHLVVIDNLETAQDVESLLATVRTLVNPSKFIFTTRHNLFQHADLYHFRLPELGAPDAFALLRHEARLRNLPHLATAGETTLQRIYSLVGGNPLALRLVVGQTHLHALDTVLGHLQHGRGQSIDRLYTHIYRSAWESLDENCRRTLLLMPLIQEDGEELSFLLAVGQRTGLAEEELLTALDQLIVLNLVDSRGDLENRRFTIHSLTRTFLQEQVLLWK